MPTQGSSRQNTGDTDPVVSYIDHDTGEFVVATETSPTRWIAADPDDLREVTA
jgi:hypothetical protein